MTDKKVLPSREGMHYLIKDTAHELSEQLGGGEVVIIARPYEDDPSVAIGNSGNIAIEDGMTMLLMAATGLLHGMRTKQQRGSLSLSSSSLDDLADFIREGLNFSRDHDNDE